jgi:tetratricopeptide (TPR) repeat protein
MGQGYKAYGYYEKALQINPRDPVAHYCLGVSAYGGYREEEALDHFAEAIIADPSYEMKIDTTIRNIGYPPYKEIDELYELVNKKLRKLYLGEET